jgi:multisubunit Na+/H+ antiporter MnhB subunit
MNPATGLTRLVARLLLPTALVTSLAILIKGYADVGDGFSAGVIAAIAVMLQYLAYGVGHVERWLPVRFAAECSVAGLVLALAVTFVPLLADRPALSHVPPPGAHVIYLGILELHTAVVFDLGVFLLVLGFLVSVVHAIARARR